jgi:hypothetical protein
MEEARNGGNVSITFRYGPRQPVDMPVVRAPARVNATALFANATYTWRVTQAQDVRPLADFEVRVGDIGPNATRLATFPVRPGHQEQHGFAFDFADDGDGMLGVNDSFTLRNATWRFLGQDRVQVWDVRADAAVGEVGLPGFEGALAVLAALGGALLRRR